MKKLLSVFLAAIMLFTLAVPTLAASEEKALKAAMTVVKQRVDIGEEYTEFDYYANDNYFGKTNLSMTWRTEDYSKYISATVCGKIITNYSINRDYSSSGTRFGDKSKAQLIVSAKEFLKQINPTVYKRLIIDEDSFSASVYNQYATLRFNRVANGVNVSDNGGSLSINKDTGEVVSFRMTWTQGSGFAKPTNVISSTKAMSQIAKLYELKPTYVMEYDWENDTRSIRLIYSAVLSGDIDAFTGKISTFEESYQEYSNEDDATAEACCDEAGENSNTGDGGVSFNEKELAAIEQNEKFLTEEQVLKILKDDKYINITDDYYLTYSYLNTDYYSKDKYIYHLEYVCDGTNYNNKYISVSMNAETGEIYSFWQTTNDGSSNSFDEDKSDKIAQDVVDTYLGDKADEYVLTSANTYNYHQFNGVTSRSYTYTRVVNGVETEFDSISVGVNYDYTVSDFSYSYTELEFPSAEMLTPAQAFEQLFTQEQPELMYKINVNDKTKVVKSALVYEMPYFRLDAKTGELYQSYYWYYNDYNDNETLTYKDLSGDLKPMAERLAEYGIYLIDENGKLNADEAITVDDFASLTSCIGSSYSNYPIYYYDYEDVIVTEDGTVDDSVANTARFITRAEAAAAIVSSLYGNKVADIKGIFKSPYSDVSEDDVYVGYIAIAAATGVMTGENGKFNPNATLTRGDALRIIYNYLDN